MTLIELIKSDYARANIEVGHLRAYMRNTHRYLNSEKMRTLEIASVEVEPRHRGQFLFTQFLHGVEILAHAYQFNAVYVECVHNERLAHYLMRWQYELADDLYPPNFFKIIL